MKINKVKKKKNKLARAIKRKTQIDDLQNRINNFGGYFPNRINIEKQESINTNSWFIGEYTKYKLNKSPKKVKFINEKLEKADFRCRKIKIYPTEEQRTILKNWFAAYLSMYNHVIKIILTRCFNKEKQTLNWRTLRTNTNNLKEIKKSLSEKTGIFSHTLDGAIQDACAALKSALTNLRNGHIKHFRLRYLKLTKPNLVLKVEKYAFSKKNNTFFSKDLGNEIKTEGDFDMRTINRDCKLHIDGKGTIRLLIPETTEPYKETKNKKNMCIALDPGVRCFLTGSTPNSDVQLGKNLYSVIRKHLTKIDKVNNEENINDKIKRKVERKHYYKIGNKIDDMHWKIIKYLIENNKIVQIGNLSTKQVINNQTGGNLNSMTKRVASLMSLYKFKQRLKYKCSINNIGYAEIDESFTSKMCSKCGWLNEELGSSKTYKCKTCNREIDRDVNGSQNIQLRGISK